MRTILIILLFMAGISCKSQNQNLDITGNWYNYYPEGNCNVSFVETYFDEAVYYYYDENFGLKFGGKYLIKEDKMFLFLDKQYEKDFIEINLTGEILELKSQEYTRCFKRIQDNSFSLQKLIKKEITENEYFDNGFQKRMQNWKKKCGNW